MNSSYLVQPKHVNIPLFVHQLKGIQEMLYLEKNCQVNLTSNHTVETRVGTFSDLPGYGKSLTVLGLISDTLDDKCSNERIIQRKKFYNDYVSEHYMELIEQTNCSLILVNISLLSQWTMELNRTLLKFVTVYNRNEIEGLDPNKYDVVVVANNVYNLFAQVHRKRSWKRFVIDEPMSLKIIGMESIHACFYWLITSTPCELYTKRKSGFLNELLPEDITVFNYLIIKNEDDFVKKSYEMPITRYIRYKCSDNISIFFEGLVNDNIFEMIEASNTNEAIESFCCNDTDNDSKEDVSNIYDAFLDKKYKRLQELHFQLSLKTNGNTDYDTQNNIGINYAEKIKIVKEQIDLFEKKLFYHLVNTFSCMINSDHSPSVLSCCQHIICKKCDEFVDMLCPYCLNPKFLLTPLTCWKNVFDKYQMSNFFEIEKSLPSLNKRNKISTILNIIDDSKKVLIFSNHNETFAILKRFLDQKSLKYLELKGTKERRDNTIDMYKTGKINIMLLNTIVSGAGLNLQETTDIILYHRLPEFQKIQVLGRANRIGREVELTVHYLE